MGEPYLTGQPLEGSAVRRSVATGGQQGVPSRHRQAPGHSPPCVLPSPDLPPCLRLFWVDPTYPLGQQVPASMATNMI